MSDIRSSKVVFVSTCKNADYVSAKRENEDDGVFINASEFIEIIEAVENIAATISRIAKHIKSSNHEN